MSPGELAEKQLLPKPWGDRLSLPGVEPGDLDLVPTPPVMMVRQVWGVLVSSSPSLKAGAPSPIEAPPGQAPQPAGQLWLGLESALSPPVTPSSVLWACHNLATLVHRKGPQDLKVAVVPRVRAGRRPRGLALAVHGNDLTPVHASVRHPSPRPLQQPKAPSFSPRRTDQRSSRVTN